MKTGNKPWNAQRLGEGKSDERNVLMKECLSAKAENSGGGKERQQNTIKAGNREADENNLKGDERKQVMSDCLLG